MELAQPCINEMFQELARVCDLFTTNAFFSLSQLDVVEAVPRSLLERAGLNPIA